MEDVRAQRIKHNIKRIEESRRDIKELTIENEFLHQEDIRDPKLTYDERWLEIKSTLVNLLERRFRYENTPPPFEKCKINVYVNYNYNDEDTRTKWFIILPSENHGVHHWKAIPLARAHPFFSTRGQDMKFIHYMANEKLINELQIMSEEDNFWL